MPTPKVPSASKKSKSEFTNEVNFNNPRRHSVAPHKHNEADDELVGEGKQMLREAKTIDEVSIVGRFAQIKVSQLDEDSKRTDYPENLNLLDAHTDAHHLPATGTGNRTTKAEENKDENLTVDPDEKDDNVAFDPNLTKRSAGNLEENNDIAPLLDDDGARRRQSQRLQIAAMRNAKNQEVQSDDDYNTSS